MTEPDIQFFEGVKDAVLSVDPNAPAAVLHVLFNDAFFLTRGDVAEVRIEQVVGTHDSKTGIDRAAFAFVDLVDSRFHVVVDAATRHSTKRSERARMGVEQHLVPLAGIGNQPECATGAELHVGDVDAAKQPADQQTFFAPVKLKGLTQSKSQWHKSA